MTRGPVAASVVLAVLSSPLVGQTSVSGQAGVDAVQGMLGLKLERVKGTVDVILVDRVERPTEN